MVAPDQVLDINPVDSLKFNGSFNEVVSTDLVLSNPCALPVAFKVKTTAPKRYAVRPNSGLLQPDESITVVVMRQPFEYDANDRVKHKFMIQTIKVLPDQDVSTIWQEADPRLMMDTRLTVQFDDQELSSKPSITEDQFQGLKDENDKLLREIDELKEERSRLRTLAVNSSPNTNPVKAEEKLPEGISLLFHEKRNIVIILLMLIMCFVCGALL